MDPSTTNGLPVIIGTRKANTQALPVPTTKRSQDTTATCPNGGTFELSRSVIEPQADDFVVATGEQLHLLLRDRRIVNLVYAGFATNICVVYRDYVLQAMRARGYRPVLLRDCTSAIETRDTFDTLLITRTLILDLERWFPTSDSAAFIQACSREP